MSNIQNLIELLDEYTVEIPIVQRDYAQGRKDDHATLVRDNLLSDIKAAILGETTSLDLSFVYGKDMEDKFIPLDGQQRLTTLFLLHIYAFRNDADMDELLHKFTYETRKSSRDFFDYLIDNSEETFKVEARPSEEIVDSEWFVSEWENDPTVQSSLVVLDEIVNKFADVEDLSEKLLQKEDKPLIFQFLKMDDLGMEDSLYIKLNARGKPLTPFESFKARLFAQLKEVDDELSKKFEILFDGKWTDFFWQEFHEEFDDGFLRFFQVLFDNNNIIDSIFNWANRFDFTKLNIKMFLNIHNTLNAIKFSEYPQIRELIVKGITANSNYYDRLLFHAVTEYINASEGRVEESFNTWLRVLKNLIVNSQIDDTRTNAAAIRGINELAPHYTEILNYLSSNGKVSGFSAEQVKEEKQKAKIILSSEIASKIIYDAENNEYFTGTVRGALHHAYKEDTFDVEVFKSYWQKISYLFEADKPKYENLVRQGLLTFSDYTLPVGDYKTLGVNDAREGSSTPSMKRLFSDYPSRVEGLLNSIHVDEDLYVQLESIVEKSDVTQNDWRYCFIHYPELFKEMRVTHLRLRFLSNRTLLVANKWSNGYNLDLYLSALQKKLEGLGIESNQIREIGTWGDIWLKIDSLKVKYDSGKYVIINDENSVETETVELIDEAANYIKETVVKLHNKAYYNKKVKAEVGTEV